MSNAQNSVMKRPYRLGKRADSQSRTRQKIVDAAVDLHSTLGPARTTVSEIAERAGVQRHTFYAHFPDERSLFLACSARALERDPLPHTEDWATVPPGRKRLELGLGELYGWFERNEQQAACVLRDAEHHALTREMVELRMSPTFARAAELLGEDLSVPSRRLLRVGMDFGCWRALADSQSPKAAAKLMTDAILALTEPGRAK